MITCNFKLIIDFSIGSFALPCALICWFNRSKKKLMRFFLTRNERKNWAHFCHVRFSHLTRRSNTTQSIGNWNFLIFFIVKKIHRTRRKKIVKWWKKSWESLWLMMQRRSKYFLKQAKETPKLYFWSHRHKAHALIEWNFSLDNFVCVTLIAHFRFSFVSSLALEGKNLSARREFLSERVSRDIIDSPTSEHILFIFVFFAFIWKWKQKDF